MLKFQYSTTSRESFTFSIKPMRSLMKRLALFLLIAFSFFACKKQDASAKNSSPDDVFYFKGVINGVSYSWSRPYRAGDDQSLINFGSTRVSMSSGGTFVTDCGNVYCGAVSEGADIYSKPVVNNSPSNVIYIEFVQATHGFNGTDNDFADVRASLEPGMKSFAFNRRSIDAPVRDGIFISYADAESHGWDSSIEWGSQDGSSFESLELIDASPDKPYLKTWKARFSCKLFQPNGCVPGVPTAIIEISGELYLPVFERHPQ